MNPFEAQASSLRVYHAIHDDMDRGLLERLSTVAVLDGKLQRGREVLDAHIAAGAPALARLSAQQCVRTTFAHYDIARARHIYVGD